ncbi:DUF6317 family protein [Streptomyces sp. PTM05]|uniref:DUF6317 family protein n=1 Tax=Streptantibioticus parmotrematis TaxID=2873249 RepID=A0ABS7QTX8_9ACTN|nr:DUF6317 family protein [Streptantibioticus parmotrematis]MBY8886647.1 DUF6317 family protein [Streptantibioticus parmotrematis]
MSADLQLVLSDLKSMSGTFTQQSKVYRDVKPKITPPIADSGDDGLDQLIRMVMETIDGLHTKMSDLIEEHGEKLGYAHDSFQRHDIDVHGVFEDLMPDE